MKIVVGCAIAAAAGLVLLSACGGGFSLPTPTPQARTPTPAPESAGVPQVACNPLLTLDDYDDALRKGIGDNSRSFSQIGVFGVSEVCRTTRKEYEGFFVQIQPGEPGDFEPGAEPISVGVFGQPVTGVGDEARWFEVEDSSTGFDVGVISVRQVTPLGVLHFRIYLGRPDLDRVAQLEIAKTLALAALPRFPGVEVEPELVTFEREPVDRSDVSYVDNLLVKEEAGEWTRGEGLVATLRLFAGELDAASVLRHSNLLNNEGTGILKIANEYLDTGPDEVARAEIALLLDLLVFSNDELEAMAGIGQTVAARPDQLAVGAARGQEDDCTQFFNDYPVPTFVGPCLEFATTFFSDDYRVFFPAPPLPMGGWDFGDYEVAIEAMEETVPIYEGLGEMPPVNIVFTVSGGGQAWAAPKAGEACGVGIPTSMKGLPDDDFKQIIAHELAHCFQEETFTQQNQVGYEIIKWREEGLAEHLSNVVPAYSKNNLEQRDWRQELEEVELQTTLFERLYTNFLFFQYLENIVGIDGIFALVRSLPKSGGLGDQADKLAQFGGIKKLYHEFARGLTDETVKDTGGGSVPYTPRADMFAISGPIILLEDPQRFGVVRLHLVVDPGKYACVEYEQNGELRSSWRDGKPGAPPGSWSDDLPESLQGEAVFVVTATEDGATFTVEVTDVDDDDPECEEEEEEEPLPTPCPFGCPPPPPSKYYH